MLSTNNNSLNMSTGLTHQYKRKLDHNFATQKPIQLRDRVATLATIQIVGD